MIKTTVNEYDFTQALMSDEYASWSYGATKALYEYYEQLSEVIGEDIELDPVAIRCEWSEYDSAVGGAKDYGYLAYRDHLSDEDEEKEAREWLEDRTTVLDVENIDTSENEYRTIKSILVMQF